MPKPSDQPLPTENKLTDWGLLRHFFHYMKPYKLPLRKVYLLYFLNSFLNLLPAMSLRYYFDLVVAPKPVHLLGWTFDTTGWMDTWAEKLHWTGIYFVGLILLIVFANTVGVFMWRLGTRVTQNLLLDIKTHIMHHLHKLSLSYFNKEQTGHVMTRAVGDVMQMQQMLKQSFAVSYMCLHLLVAPLLMLLMSWQLFLVVLVPVPVIFWAIRRIRIKLRPLYRQQRERQAQVNATVQEQISGIREIKAFGQEEEAQRDVSRANEAYRDSVNNAMRIFSVNHQVLYGTRDLAMVMLASTGGAMIVMGWGDVSVGMIMAFLPLMNRFFDPFTRLAGFYDVIQRGMASAERVFQFFDIQPDIKDKPGAKWADLDEGRVRFENVSFWYDEGTEVLKDINLDVQPGEVVAIVGSTGSGKSTLAALIPRFYDPQQGRILIDDHPLDEVKMDAIRSAVGIVFQENFLFYGSVAQNIAFSRPTADLDEVVRAAKLANIHEFISQLPEGYDSHIGERGVTLSGGQRQRIAIARMILKDPAIIVLDEATSALDTTTEAAIQESMDRLMKGRTSFVIAHRLSTIRSADRILVLEHGQIVETGTHEELLARNGRYAQMASIA
jgi:ABC-type multidrug transport system fused ATPase/permease subunit